MFSKQNSVYSIDFPLYERQISIENIKQNISIKTCLYIYMVIKYSWKASIFFSEHRTELYKYYKPTDNFQVLNPLSIKY